MGPRDRRLVDLRGRLRLGLVKELMRVCAGPSENGRMYSACRICRAELEKISACAGTGIDETCQSVLLCPIRGSSGAGIDETGQSMYLWPIRGLAAVNAPFVAHCPGTDAPQK